MLRGHASAGVSRPHALELRHQQSRHSALVVSRSSSGCRNGRKRARMLAQSSTEEPVSARKSGLALMLDDGTRKSHSIAENTEFVSGFFKGIATKDSFAKLVKALYFVYLEMEQAFDKTTDENVRALDYKELRRSEALEDDMAYYFGEDWQSAVKPSVATKKYIDRIREVAENSPELLIAHQYTRYLGDLFGGQMMGSMATRSLELENGKGIKFYQFDDIPSTKDFIEDWYMTLNSLDLPGDTKQAIVDEGNLVFRLNIEIFSELEGNAFGSFLRVAWASFREKYLQ